jgi:hypothetical protein
MPQIFADGSESIWKAEKTNQGKPVQTTIEVGKRQFRSDLNINLQHFLFLIVLRMVS